MNNQNVSAIIADENYSKGFKDGRKLKGRVIAIEQAAYLLTAAQYAKFTKMYKDIGEYGDK